jgi:hypothetical protein
MGQTAAWAHLTVDGRPWVVEQLMILRAVASALLAGSVVLLAARIAPAQDANAGPAPGGPSVPAAGPTAVPVKYLHDRLGITAEQEELWGKVSQAIHDNALALGPLARERRRATLSGTAPELMHAYEALGNAQLDGQRKLIAAFEPLYASLSESQKKIADSIIRESAQSALFLFFPSPPFVPAPACPVAAPPSCPSPAVAYPAPWREPGVRVAAHPAVGVGRVHSFAAPHRHSVRFRRR